MLRPKTNLTRRATEKTPFVASADHPRRPWLRSIGVVGVLAVAATYAVSLIAQPPVPALHAAQPITVSLLDTNQTQGVDFEKVFVDGIDREKLKEYLHAYASKPHPVGSKQDYATAVYTKEQFEKFGLKAEIAARLG